jgi:hypothetical protein
MGYGCLTALLPQAYLAQSENHHDGQRQAVQDALNGIPQSDQAYLQASFAKPFHHTHQRPELEALKECQAGMGPAVEARNALVKERNRCVAPCTHPARKQSSALPNPRGSG